MRPPSSGGALHEAPRRTAGDEAVEPEPKVSTKDDATCSIGVILFETVATWLDEERRGNEKTFAPQLAAYHGSSFAKAFDGHSFDAERSASQVRVQKTIWKRGNLAESQRAD
mmetsp:Transcript_77583/g.122360  ORF Transcript_77583/g.122360 Transcript_77583/m.122360 type:complete len:112 (+) Transcript_77583:38-373(+)